MNAEKKNRNKWLHVRLTEEELASIHKQFKKTTEPKLSDYTRKMLLSKPVIASARDQSLQDILSVLIDVRKDLNGAANNFNQLVKKLHMLYEMKANQELFQLLLSSRIDVRTLLQAVEEIRITINKTAEKWLLG